MPENENDTGSGQLFRAALVVTIVERRDDLKMWLFRDLFRDASVLADAELAACHRDVTPHTEACVRRERFAQLVRALDVAST